MAYIGPNNIDWKEFGSFCYSTDNTARSFIEAKYICEQKGAFVTSVHSIEESEFVNSLSTPSGGSLWIGLEKKYSSDSYEWNDGSSLSYTKFTVGSNPTKPCVYMYFNFWYDADCINSRLKSVCKRAKSK